MDAYTLGVCCFTSATLTCQLVPHIWRNWLLVRIAEAHTGSVTSVCAAFASRQGCKTCRLVYIKAYMRPQHLLQPREMACSVLAKGLRLPALSLGATGYWHTRVQRQLHGQT